MDRSVLFPPYYTFNIVPSCFAAWARGCQEQKDCTACGVMGHFGHYSGFSGNLLSFPFGVGTNMEAA